MAPTLRRITAIAPLRLRVVAAADALDRPVRWVAVSELADPTPFLEGGELVLTTGMSLSDTGAGPYVDRLVARGVSGLGFGVGVGHDAIPPALEKAAEQAGLPLIEVPRDTPFVAIGKAVSDLLAAERYEEVTRAFSAQGRLTRAALRPGGVSAMVGRLATEIDGWAVLFDPAGTVLAMGGPARAHIEEVRSEIDRLRTGRGTSSIAVSTPDRHVVVQPLGTRPRGFFAVGAAHPFSPVAHTVINVACSLLTLALEQDAGPSAARRRVRAAVLRLLLAGQVNAARETLAALGERLPEGGVTLMVTEAAADAAAEAAACAFTAEWDGVTVLLVPTVTAAAALRALARLAPTGVSDPLGEPAEGDDDKVAAALNQARQALAAARRAGVPSMRFADLPGQGLLGLLDTDAATAFAQALLAPLTRYGSRPDLLASLRAYLEANGHWDAAAQRLGVHRHTLRHRMRRVADLLGRDLEDPATRAELWVACSLCGVTPSPPGSAG